MHAALICPVPDLKKYVDRGATHHLLLAHLFDIPGYIEFYRERVELYDDYVIVDNGAKENGRGLGLKKVLELGHLVRAKEVVVADVRYECDATIESAQKELAWLASKEGQQHYTWVGQPRLMVVPQGETPERWFECLLELTRLVAEALQWTPHPQPVIGVAYHYDHLFEAGLNGLLDLPVVQRYDVHLLGWPRALRPLLDASKRYRNLRSVDSSRPFVYAKGGLGNTRGYPGFEANPYPSRDEQFFTESISPSLDNFVRANVAHFRRYAGDVAGQSRCIECGSTRLNIRNYSMMWHDGDLYCENGHYVRGYDAG
jgi:hypothetical protein